MSENIKGQMSVPEPDKSLIDRSKEMTEKQNEIDNS